MECRGSWVTEDLRRCYQIVECDDRRLLDEWMTNWNDITDLRSFPLSPLRAPKPPSLRGPDSGSGTQNFFNFPPKFPRDPASLPSSGISEGVRRLSGRVDGKECPLQSMKEVR
jgi:hypothetical protein